MMTSFSVCALLIGGLLASRPAYAESYNLRCSVSGSEMARLVVRDNWISHHMPPDVRVILSKPGETAPVDLKSYTDDKVQVGLNIESEGYPGQQSSLEITIDRNTGVAHFVFYAPWQTTGDGAKSRKSFSEADGACIRERPKF